MFRITKHFLIRNIIIFYDFFVIISFAPDMGDELILI
jgi:hypothetical protein